jgi:hypothetical protein
MRCPFHSTRDGYMDTLLARERDEGAVFGSPNNNSFRVRNNNNNYSHEQKK